MSESSVVKMIDIVYDVAIVGGGVVGCGVARALTLGGFKVVILEKEDAVAIGRASGGNTGIACTHHDCDEGTLEYELLKEASALNLEAYELLNVPHQRSGALYLAWSEEEASGPLKEMAAKHGATLTTTTTTTAATTSNGDKEGSGGEETAVLLTGVAALEEVAGKGLWEASSGGGGGRVPVAGLWVKGEVTVDPWLVPIAWVTQAVANGATLRLGCSVVAASFDSELEVKDDASSTGARRNQEEGASKSKKKGAWLLSVENAPLDDDDDDGGGADESAAAMEPAGNTKQRPAEEVVAASVVVNCGGLWADDVNALSSSPAAASESAAAAAGASIGRVSPHKGDYVIFGSLSGGQGGASEGAPNDNDGGALPPPPPPLLLPVGGVPLPSGGGRGLYVWRTVHGDVVCGPTNEPCERPPTSTTSSTGKEEEQAASVGVSAESATLLEAAAASMLPALFNPATNTTVKGSYWGLRPALSCGSDYVIGFDHQLRNAQLKALDPAPPAPPGGGGHAPCRPRWLTCAGVRSTGLTASLAIGEHVRRLLLRELDPSNGDEDPDNLGSSSSSSSGLEATATATTATTSSSFFAPLRTVKWPRLPDLDALRESFANRNDGKVDIHFTMLGVREEAAATATRMLTKTHRVTHPQTRFGLSTRPPFRPISQHPPLHALIEALKTNNENQEASAAAARASDSSDGGGEEESGGEAAAAAAAAAAPLAFPLSPLTFLTHATEASVLRGGYTNQLYLVRVPPPAASPTAPAPPLASSPAPSSFEGLWVVRKSAGAKDGGLDDDPLYRVHKICRFSEHGCVQASAAQGIAPRAFFDPHANLLAQEYISEPETFTSRDVKESLAECVDLLRKLHTTVEPRLFAESRNTLKRGGDDGHVFHVFETAERYLGVLRGENPTKDDSWARALPLDVGQLIEAGRSLSHALDTHSGQERWPLTACHNDLVVGNWVRGSLSGDDGQRRLYLIDFEYAARGDRCFDLANLCVNSELSDHDTDRVINRYLDGADKIATSKSKLKSTPWALSPLVTPCELRARVELLKLLSDLREGLWAFAHGSSIRPLVLKKEKAGAAAGAGGTGGTGAAGAASAVGTGDGADGDNNDDGGGLPSSFYVKYGLRHLDRFRRNACVVSTGHAAGSASSELPSEKEGGSDLAERVERIAGWVKAVVEVRTGPL